MSQTPADSQTPNVTVKPNPKLRPRPLSPHLQVYKPEFTSLTSISHRGAGIFNFLNAFVLVYFLAAYAFWPEKECFKMFFDSIIGKLYLIAATASLYYHLSNGIRHLFWDAGYGYVIQTARKSAYAVFIATILLTAVTWYMILI